MIIGSQTQKKYLNRVPYYLLVSLMGWVLLLTLFVGLSTIYQKRYLQNKIVHKGSALTQEWDQAKILSQEVGLIPYQGLNLNTINAHMLIDCPWCDPIQIRALLNYRNRLGGFVSLQQINEIPGWHGKAASKLISISCVSSTFMPVQIDINTASLRQLARHPYIGYHKAKKIIRYRKMHGVIDSREKLRKIAGFTTYEFDQLAPYLTQ